MLTVLSVPVDATNFAAAKRFLELGEPSSVLLLVHALLTVKLSNDVSEQKWAATSGLISAAEAGDVVAAFEILEARE